MGQEVREFMTSNPVMMEGDALVTEVARKMRDADIGDVIVLDNGELEGIVTDRDIVVRCIANGLEPSETPVQEICSSDPVTVSPETDVNEVVDVIRERAVRRVIVAEDGRPVGIVSLGDLATRLDPNSALAQVSRAVPTR